MTFSSSFNVASGGLFSGVKNADILEFKDLIMCILWTRILPQGCITVSWLPLLCLFIPSLLKLAIDWISPLEMALKNGSEDKASACKVEDLGSIPGSGRSPGEGKGSPHQDSCLENPMDGEACCRLQSMGSQRVRHDWVTLLTFHFLEIRKDKEAGVLLSSFMEGPAWFQ